MPPDSTPNSTRLRKLAGLVVLGILFALSYTQSPLYTSNQNQYFLHGLAKAGYGYLKQDWLANTLDPTPVFSSLIYLTYRLTHQTFLFYLYYALLLGVYLYCLVGIATSLFDLRRTPARWWSFLAIIFLVHSAALRFTFSRLLGDNWTYLLEDGVADQRLLGPVLQPSAFGVLLIVSIYLFLRRKPILAALAAALAATIHPTYLLSAGALTLAYMLVTYLEQRRLKTTLLIGLTALLAVTPILYYVYSSFGNTPPETSARAQDILVNIRIPFHALVNRWFDLTAIIKIAIILSALYLARRTRLFFIMLVPLAVAVLLTLLQVAMANNTLALLFPWRISTFLLPLATTTLLGAGIVRLFTIRPTWERPPANVITIISGLIIGLVVLIGLVRLVLDFQRQAAAPIRPIMAYVAAHHAPDQYYLVPLDMQDFRLATGSPVYVEFKSIPYKDRDVLEWARRIQTADLFYKKADCGSLEKMARIGVTHVVVGRKLFDLDCSEWKPIYQDENYGLFELR